MNQLFNNPIFLKILIVILLICVVVQTIRGALTARKLRKDAVKRSKAVIGGQVFEQVAPFLPNFPCNPADARFVGKPVDFVAFSGLSETNKIDEVLLVEVKTGQSALSSREKEIKKAVEEGRVRYVEYRI